MPEPAPGNGPAETRATRRDREEGTWRHGHCGSEVQTEGTEAPDKAARGVRASPAAQYVAGLLSPRPSPVFTFVNISSVLPRTHDALHMKCRLRPVLFWKSV